MGIDLGNFPSIGSGGLTGGAMVAQFGRQIQEFGAALGRRAKYTQTQQSFLSLQAAKELIAAKDAYYTSENEFNKLMDQSMDYESQPEAWDRFNASALERIQESLTLEESKVRGLAMRLPRFAPGQPIPVVSIPGISDEVRGIWSLWRIAISTMEWNRRRIMPLFLADNGMVYMPTRPFALQDLHQEGLVLGMPFAVKT